MEAGGPEMNGIAADVAPISAGGALAVRMRVPRTGFDVHLALSVAAGETLALMGPSGAGKSSVLHAIAGTERIVEGRITLERAPGDAVVLADASRRTHLPPHQRAIGMLGQDPRLFPHLTAHGNIAFGARAGGQSKRDADAAATAWLNQLTLTEVSRQRPAQLSGGQRQRIALARALAARPALLLIDEPFASLDVEAAQNMRELVRTELDRTGTTAIVVSHSAVDAVALAHRLVVMERGVVVQQGEVREVLAAPATSFVRAVAATLPR